MTTISQRALGIQEIPEKERHLEEVYRLKHDEWAEADGLAFHLAESKTTVLAKMVTNLMMKEGQMAAATAERLVKSSNDWSSFLLEMKEARVRANKLKGELDAMRMYERRVNAASWGGNQVRTMGRSSP